MKAIKYGVAAQSAAWVFVVCALSLAACTADQEIKCGEGTELVGGRCVPLDGGGSGGNGGDGGGPNVICGDGSIEANGACEGKRPIGSACETGEQCLSDTCLTEERGAPDGYCTQLACNPSRPCEAGSQCYYSRTEKTFLCLVYCDDDDDCRDDYACQPLYTSDVSVCAPSCTVSGACPAGTLCNASNGKCELHECELGASGQCGSDDDAGAEDVEAGALVCYADRLGISSSGAVCLPSCNPSASPSTCAGNEVCQPLPEDPQNSGLCVPPLCAVTSDCSAGAVCMQGVCQPPARCDDAGECAGGDELFVCVGGPGGQCMQRCPEDGDEGCAAIHPDLSCAPTLDACLPVGAYPGSTCRSDLNDPCSALTVRVGDEAVSTPMACEDGVCIASCADGGNALCAGIDSSLTCAEGIFDAPSCLPKGSFPGGPCGSGDACDNFSAGGNTVQMACAPVPEQDTCLAICNDAAGGDQLCDAIDASLVCIADAFGTTTDMCLPRGAYPGGPCGPADTCSTGMTCEDNRCLYQCTTGGDTQCSTISPALSCAETVYDEPVCLPLGTFPGSPCRPGGDQCDVNLGGLADADMVCANDSCVVQCEAPGAFDNGDALCRTVSPLLTCLSNPSGVDVCVIACGDGDACPSGYSCLTSQDSCLPTGSFLGSPCAGGTMCSAAATPPLACGPTGSCGAACADSPYCQGLGGMLGQPWDTCGDPDGAGPGGTICFDAP